MIFPRIPGTLFLKGAVAVLYTVAVYGLGNLHATERVMKEQEALMLDDSAKRQAKNHSELIAWYAERMKELRLAREQQHKADVAAFKNADNARIARERDLRAARASLAKALETPNVIVTPAIPSAPDSGCVLPGGVRIAINDYIATINNHPTAVGDTQAPPARMADGSDSSNQPLTCPDLASSVIDILNHDAMLTGWVLSWQSWATEALK